MTKKENKKGTSKKHVLDKESCGLSYLKEIVQNNNEKKTNVSSNPTNIQSTYSTPRESYLETLNNTKHFKEQSNRPHSAPQIHNSKNQCCQPPRSSRRTLERQDTPRPRSETPPIVRQESCVVKVHSKSKFKGLRQRFFEAIKKKSKCSNSRMTHSRLPHRSWSPNRGHSISPKASMGRYGSISRSPRGYHQHTCASSRRGCTNHQCEERRCKSRACGLCIIS